MTTMEFYSVEYWQENWETLMERVENGETIGVENDNGEKAVMVPADDELIQLVHRTRRRILRDCRLMVKAH